MSVEKERPISWQTMLKSLAGVNRIKMNLMGRVTCNTIQYIQYRVNRIKMNLMGRVTYSTVQYLQYRVNRMKMNLMCRVTYNAVPSVGLISVLGQKELRRI